MQVSVITTVYNETREQIKRAINSVFEQLKHVDVLEHVILEHVIVVDNPEFNDINFLYSMSDHLNSDNFSLKVIVNQENIGLANSLNKAIANSSFELLARLDADDWMNEGRLIQQGNELISNEADIVYTDTLLFKDGKNEAEYLKSFNDKKVDELLPLRNFIPHSSVLMSKKSFLEVGEYRDLVPAEDYDLWLRFNNQKFKFCYIPEALTSREIRSDSVSNSDLELQMRMAYFVRRINKKDNILNSDDLKRMKPQKMTDIKSLNKINQRIHAFRNANGLHKYLIGFSSFFIIRMSFDDILFKMKIIF
ncbi:6-N-acetylglucosamine synthase (BcsA) [Fructobacillus cardui]|uniref:glycosyltransferase n=1 Tax=Fructobacillus cardui TaxID=2893170 RepID=UPI002DAB8330|nr:6-N-acetylglucosamine synthase (BcsA) [Fructobacillus cardui]